MGILGKFNKSSNSALKKNSNVFTHLQKQAESIQIDTEVLVRCSESYLKLFNKKSKSPQNLVTQGSSKSGKKAPLELMSLASLQASQTLNNTCHLSRVYMEFSDAHRHMYEKQKDMVVALNNYIKYLNSSLEEFKKYETIKSLYVKNFKNFVSYQNKLKKQTQAITPEQKSKNELLYKNYEQSLTSLAEKMAELTSNRKEAERTKHFVDLIDFEINFYQSATNELTQLKQFIARNYEMAGENKFSERKSEQEFVEEIVSNKLELENFNTLVSQPANGKIVHENSDSNFSSKNSLSSKENSYQNLGIIDYNGNNYGYDYAEDGYYNDQYTGYDQQQDNRYSQQDNGYDQQANGSNAYGNNLSNPAPVDNSPSAFDDYLNLNNIKSLSLEENERTDSLTPFTSDKNNIKKRQSVINKENLANLKPSEKVYNTKELDPKYCKAIYPFQKSMDDELELEANDLVDVTKKYDDGWATGINLKSGKEGFFPLNCLLEFYVTDKFADYGGSKENSESYVYSNTN